MWREQKKENPVKQIYGAIAIKSLMMLTAYSFLNMNLPLESIYHLFSDYTKTILMDALLS